MKDIHQETVTFENSDPKRPFSELVRISLRLTGCLVAYRKQSRADEGRAHLQVRMSTS